MKGFQILLLFLCGSLTLAENEQTYRAEDIDLFGPLNKNLYPILFKGIHSYYQYFIDELSKLNFAEKRHLLAEYKQTYDNIRIPPIASKVKKHILISEDVESTMNRVLRKFHAYNDKEINWTSDWTILLNLAINYNEKIHLLNNTSTNSYNKYEYDKFLDFIRHSYVRSYRSDFLRFYLTHNDIELQVFQIILQQNVCHRKMSMQQMLGNLRGHIAFRNVQKLLAEWFAVDSQNFTLPQNNKLTWREGVSTRLDYPSKDFFKSFRYRMVNASREVWNCDPKNHIHDVTYTKLERAFKAFSSEERAANCDTSYQPICHRISDNSDRYFDLRPVFSNVYNNSVITGMRLVKKNHIVRIQIQEGQLLPYGIINKTSVTWTPIKDYTSCENCFVLKNGSNTVSLDDVVLSNPNSLLTGISFEKIKESDGEESLRLVAYSTPFNFTIGKLLISEKNLPWKIEYPKPLTIPDYYHRQFEGLNFFSHLSDKLYYALICPSLKTKLTFNENRLKTGETEVTPYIDLQPVTTIPPSPMSGAGLMYRNETNEFLSLKLFTFDFAPFLNRKDEVDDYSKNVNESK